MVLMDSHQAVSSARVSASVAGRRISGSQPVGASSRSAIAASSAFFAFSQAGAVSPLPSLMAARMPLLESRPYQQVKAISAVGYDAIAT
jgi:hypothetical protein